MRGTKILTWQGPGLRRSWQPIWIHSLRPTKSAGDLPEGRHRRKGHARGLAAMKLRNTAGQFHPVRLRGADSTLRVCDFTQGRGWREVADALSSRLSQCPQRG
jgi:hypothetical protein